MKIAAFVAALVLYFAFFHYAFHYLRQKEWILGIIAVIMVVVFLVLFILSLNEFLKVPETDDKCTKFEIQTWLSNRDYPEMQTESTSNITIHLTCQNGALK